ncbi:Acg family FMN-binding oxidoreductase [Kitasatospora sp. NPDC088346]|uniref:Acg family FMN-binding oxidoreductase n=1 Tax=Kitasatospora sp. NPDC088346 TaxID=3364073 RepID=UPI0037FD0784
MDILVLDAAAVERLIAAAVAAPSIHNSQPWRFRLDPDTSTIEVRALPERSLPATDPDDRALHISVGAAVLNLRIAARRAGWAPAVRLLPDSAEPDLLAEVELTDRSHARLASTGELYDAIWRRHTVRTPFTGPPIPAEVLDRLAETAQAEEALLHFPTGDERARLLELTAEAERRNTTDPVRSSESRRWIRGPGAPAYGIPAAALGPQDSDGRMPMRDFTAIHPQEPLAPALFETRPCIALLSTRGDAPVDWLRAGIALQHLLLVATVHGVRASLLHQAMEWPELRRVARDPQRGPSHPQVLIRLGYGPEGAPTPRLAVSDVLDPDVLDPDVLDPDDGDPRRP